MSFFTDLHFLPEPTRHHTHQVFQMTSSVASTASS